MISQWKDICSFFKKLDLVKQKLASLRRESKFWKINFFSTVYQEFMLTKKARRLWRWGGLFRLPHVINKISVKKDKMLKLICSSSIFILRLNVFCIGRGGQSALRFARLRMEKRHNYVRKVAETAVQMFITNDKVALNILNYVTRTLLCPV